LIDQRILLKQYAGVLSDNDVNKMSRLLTLSLNMILADATFKNQK